MKLKLAKKQDWTTVHMKDGTSITVPADHPEIPLVPTHYHLAEALGCSENDIQYASDHSGYGIGPDVHNPEYWDYRDWEVFTSKEQAHKAICELNDGLCILCLGEFHEEDAWPRQPCEKCADSVTVGEAREALEHWAKVLTVDWLMGQMPEIKERLKFVLGKQITEYIVEKRLHNFGEEDG